MTTDLEIFTMHDDSRNSLSGDKLATAFRLFNDEKIKVLLVKGADAAGHGL